MEADDTGTTSVLREQLRTLRQSLERKKRLFYYICALLIASVIAVITTALANYGQIQSSDYLGLAAVVSLGISILALVTCSMSIDSVWCRSLRIENTLQFGRDLPIQPLCRHQHLERRER